MKLCKGSSKDPITRSIREQQFYSETAWPIAHYFYEEMKWVVPPAQFEPACLQGLLDSVSEIEKKGHGQLQVFVLLLCNVEFKGVVIFHIRR